jgi:hypothetical protein
MHQSEYPRTGPILRDYVPCWDCGAQPGQRHTTACDLAPTATWLRDKPHQYAPGGRESNDNFPFPEAPWPRRWQVPPQIMKHYGLKEER